MGFVLCKDKAGRLWQVDPDGIKRLIRSFVHSGAMLSRSQTVPEKQDLGWLGKLHPLTLVTVQTDFDAVAKDVDSHADAVLRDFNRQLKESGEKAFQTLVGYRNATINRNEEFREMQQDASQQTSDSIAGAVSFGERGEKIARGIRDLCTTMLMVGAGVISGGAGIAALGASSVAKGGATWEDKWLEGKSTGEAVAAGTLEAASDLVVGMVAIGEGAVVKDAIRTGTAGARAGAGILVFHGAMIDGTTEFAKATIDGKTVRESLMRAGTRAALHVGLLGLDVGLESAFSSARLSKLSFPITVIKSSEEPTSLSRFVLNVGASSESDEIVQSIGSDPTTESSDSSDRLRRSLACTYLSLGNSDAVFVEQNAMRAAHSR
ncbi:MAG TPA: hypothetical protein VL991_03360 [Terracidiphilus sp.]|nr:hypothetical protein [Terracidiphilus sp.]